MNLKPLVAVAALFAFPSFAQEKKCAALKDDGSVVVEFSYAPGKYSECSARVKTEMAKAQCKPGDKKAKFTFRAHEAAKPSAMYADCKLAAEGQ